LKEEASKTKTQVVYYINRVREKLTENFRENSWV